MITTSATTTPALVRTGRTRWERAAATVGAVLLVAGGTTACSSAESSGSSSPAAATEILLDTAGTTEAPPATGSATSGDTDDTTGTAATTVDTGAPDSATPTPSAAAATPSIGTPATADDFIRVMELAIAAAGGVGAESIDRDRNGFEVDVQLADGSDRSVFVPAEGEPTVGSDDDDDNDSTPDPVLTADQIRSLFAAVASYSPTAEVRDLSTDDDGAPFEVTIREPDGTETDLDADATFSLTVTDIDGPGED